MPSKKKLVPATDLDEVIEAAEALRERVHDLESRLKDTSEELQFTRRALLNVMKATNTQDVLARRVEIGTSFLARTRIANEEHGVFAAVFSLSPIEPGSSFALAVGGDDER